MPDEAHFKDLLSDALLRGDAPAVEKLKNSVLPAALTEWKNHLLGRLTDRVLKREAPFCQLTAFAQGAEPLYDQKARPVICCGAVKGNESTASRDYILMLLRARGLPVLDLGTDLAPAAFLNAVRDQNITTVICTVFSPQDFDTVAALHNQAVCSGLRARFRLAVCGAEHAGRYPEILDCPDYRAAAVAQWAASESDSQSEQGTVPCSPDIDESEQGTVPCLPDYAPDYSLLGQETFSPRPDREEIFAWLQCSADLPCRKAYENAWESAVELLYRHAAPRAVLCREGLLRLTALVTLGSTVQACVSSLFRSGQYITGDLLNTLCDQMLFQMDDGLSALIGDMLKPEGLYIAERLEPGIDLKTKQMQHFMNQIRDFFPDVHLTEHGALSPAKSMLYAVTLTSTPCRHALHDCSRCPQTNCLYRKKNP